MSPTLADPEDLVALGAFAGALVLVVCFSVIIANAYRERALMIHAAGASLAILTLQLMAGGQRGWPQATLLVLLSVSGFQLRELVSHAGALRAPRLWLVGICLGALPLLAAATYFGNWALPPGLAAWVAVIAVVLLRAWPQSMPWIQWMVPGLAALTLAGAFMVWHMVRGPGDMTPWVGLFLVVWAACVYLSTVWRSRIFGETRVRMAARNTVDPLTGLVTLMVLAERTQGARTMMRRYGHPSVLMLVNVDNLPGIAAEFGPEAGEAAVLAAANRIRQCLREGDVAARLAHSRVGLLLEGVGTPEAASTVASRVLAAGLREPVAGTPEFLHFRMVLAPVPDNDVPARQLLARLNARLDAALREPGDRRIVTLSSEDMQA